MVFLKEKYEQRHGEKKQVERNRLAPIPAQETEPCPGYAACGAGNPQNTVEWTAEKTFPRQQAKVFRVHSRKERLHMTQEKVDMYAMTNQKYLPAEKIVFVKQKLLQADETKFQLASTVEFKLLFRQCSKIENMPSGERFFR